MFENFVQNGLLDSSALVSGLFGAFAGGIIQQLIGQSQLKLSTTMRLYDEFNQETFIKTRMHVSDLLEKNRKSKSPKCLSELESALDNRDWSQIELIRFFFERLVNLYESNLVNKKLVKTYFGKIGAAWLSEFDYLDQLDNMNLHSRVLVHRFNKSHVAKIFGKDSEFLQFPVRQVSKEK